jgi:hypothetical protein
VLILETLQRLCQTLPMTESGKHIPLSGPELLDKIGGPAHVLQTISAYVLALDQPEPFVDKPGQVDKVPYRFIPSLLTMLDRECRLALTGQPYPHRLILTNGELHILQKREVNIRMPERCIWLDATADPYLYERVFERKIQTVAPQVKRQGTIYQVWHSTNSRGKFKASDDDPEQAKTNLDHVQAQIKAIVQRGYRQPTIISYKNLMDSFVYQSGYFGAARGTNSFIGTDCLIIVGTPQIAPDDLETEAKMLFWERDDPFRLERSERPQPYGNILGQGMLVNGYWDDTDLQALHAQKRDAELVQVAYRARPLQHAVDIWLLTSHPIEHLPPDHLVSLQELFMSPDGIAPYLWQRFTEYIADKDFITSSVVAQDLAIDGTVARRIILALIKQRHEEWRKEVAASRGGRPATAAARNKGDDTRK